MLLLPPVASGKPTVDIIHHCSALELLRALPDGCVDLVVTSPPYADLRSYNGYDLELRPIAANLYRVLKVGGVVVWVVGDKTDKGTELLTPMRQALYFVDVAGFLMHDTMIWDKHSMTFPDTKRYIQVWEYMFVLSKGSPKTANLQTKLNVWAGQSVDKRRRIDGDNLAKNPHAKDRKLPAEGPYFNLWRIDTGFNKTTSDTWLHEYHPAMFPEKLAERHILTWTNRGDLVLDIFMGSGTTAKVARANGRHYLGCDISAEYVALARKRLAQPYNMRLPLFEVAT